MGWGAGGASVGEGTGGEAHELKQGAHDEEEEPVNCSTHTHVRTLENMHRAQKQMMG